MLLEIDDKTASLIQTALDIGAYPNEQALLDAGLDDARAKVAIWVKEMQRRDREDARIPSEAAFSQVRAHLEALRGEIEGE
ncbi:MAG: hypothetical protein AAFO57_01990 [Pseudomonadota bacterium]